MTKQKFPLSKEEIAEVERKTNEFYANNPSIESWPAAIDKLAAQNDPRGIQPDLVIDATNLKRKEELAYNMKGMTPADLVQRISDPSYILNDPDLVNPDGSPRTDIVVSGSQRVDMKDKGPGIGFKFEKRIESNSLLDQFTFNKKKEVESKPLLDQIQEGLSVGRGQLLGVGRKPDIAEARLLATLRQANCFTLSDDFTKNAALLSINSKPSELYNLWQSAKPAYPVMWIEFDEYTRGKELAEAQGGSYSQEPDKTGYLIEQDQNDPAKYHVTVACSTKSDRAAWITPVGFMIDIEKDATSVKIDFNHPRPYQGCASRDLPPDVTQLATQFQMSEQEGLDIDAMSARLGVGPFELAVMGRQYVMHRNYSAEERLYLVRMLNRLRLEASPVWAMLTLAGTHMAHRALPSGGLQATEKVSGVRAMQHIFGKAALSLEGDARFVTMILGLLQTTWVQTASVRPAIGKRYVRGKTLPYLEQHTLTIVAPKERQITIRDVLRHNIEPGQIRRHEVIGTWVHDLSRLKRDCMPHEWTPNGKGSQQECSKCGSLRWWRIPHERGNAALGYALKDYKVEAPA